MALIDDIKYPQHDTMKRTSASSLSALLKYINHYLHLHLVLCLFLCPPAEFSRESLLEAAGGLECPLSKEKEDCSGVANVADPSSQQNNAQAGTRE